MKNINYYKRHMDLFKSMNKNQRKKYRSQLRTMIELSEGMVKKCRLPNVDASNRLIDAKQFLFDTTPSKVNF